MLLRLILFTFSLLLIRGGKAQDSTSHFYAEDDDDTVEFRKNFVGIYGFLDNGYRGVYTSNGVLAGQQISTFSSYTLGIGCLRQIRRNISIEINVELSSEKYTTSRIKLPLDTSIKERQPSSVWYDNHAYFVNIPVGFRYTVGNKFRIGCYIGLAPKISLEDEVRIHTTYTDNTYTADGNSYKGKRSGFNLNARLGLFAEYNFRKTRLRVMPVFRYDLLNTFGKINHRKGSTKGIGIEFMI
jgi:hypothetical protein